VFLIQLSQSSSCEYESSSCEYVRSSCEYKKSSCEYGRSSCEYEKSSCEYESRMRAILTYLCRGRYFVDILCFWFG
jgi:hypothetical protein